MKFLIDSFTACLGFLTRLAPPRMYENHVFAAAMWWFGVVGLILGTLLVTPFAVGVLRGQPWIQAWLLLGGSLTLTRGLHWDGWADLFDGWGSNATGDRFWEIVKDSRNGAFGVIALIMGLSGQLLLMHQLFAAQAYGFIFFAFIFGRAMCVFTAYLGRKMTRPGQGKLSMDGATTPVALFHLCMVLFFAWILGGWRYVLPVLCLGAIGLTELYSLGRKHGAMNGDFLGAAVIWGELSAMLAGCIALNFTGLVFF
ncbi:adenosylcobinamide-GDP ribazoletransferase [Desulfobaculum bizertense]|uniref:Adenosylcobinamide-GDP ribazoletransferase n=1 Tax=Desulfobaculum bizertense DSM 18034 TaxID=1121442 RepID=A0A1T4WBN9_9BACT|nr:adenosylcobinamide-GDP ribazoletransferase [Desulfobaculum bizertense]SKA74539.1 cobalamin-5'-phosphate synthase [Desulfobaculum bizertense DSM 18034]